MFAKTIALYCLAAFSAVAYSAPEPVERRQFDSVINSITSAAVSEITGGGASLLSGLTSVGGDITSLGGNVVSHVTSFAEGAFQTATSVGGEVATGVTSVGSEAITLATSIAGDATSIAGDATSIAGDATALVGSLLSNVAVSTYSFGFTFGHAVGFMTVLSGALVGAMITL